MCDTYLFGFPIRKFYDSPSSVSLCYTILRASYSIQFLVQNICFLIFYSIHFLFRFNLSIFFTIFWLWEQDHLINLFAISVWSMQIHKFSHSIPNDGKIIQVFSRPNSQIIKDFLWDIWTRSHAPEDKSAWFIVKIVLN